MKRLRLIKVAAVLLLLCACSVTVSLSGEDIPSPAFKVGYPSNSDGGPFTGNFQTVVEAAGGEWIVELCDLTPIGTVLAVTRLIEAGCDGIIVMPTSESILPQIAEICDEAGVYWVTSMRPVLDPKILEILNRSTHYAGGVMEDDEKAGYDLMKTLGEAGKKSVALISISKSDPVGAARERGLYLAAEEYGVEIVAEIRNANSSEEVYNAVSDVLVAKPEIDAVFRVGGFFSIRPGLNAVEDAENSDEIHFVTIDFESISEEDFNEGRVLAVAGGHKPLDAALSAALLVHAIQEDHPGDGSGEKPFYVIDYLLLNTAEELSQYRQFYTEREGILYSEESARQRLLGGNEKPSAVDFDDIISGYTIDNIRHINSQADSTTWPGTE